MAATNFTPIILYHSTTVAATPSAGNLNNGELAINITDDRCGVYVARRWDCEQYRIVLGHVV